MTRHTLLTLNCAVVLLALTACNNSTTAPPFNSGPTVPSADARGTLVLFNPMGRVFADIRITACGSGPTGDNLVDVDTSQLEWSLAPGCYDVSLRVNGKNWEVHQARIQPGQSTQVVVGV
jgi:hypothetical protein